MGTRLNSNSLQNEASNISQATHPLCQPCRPKVVLSNFANFHQPQGIPKPQSHVPHLSTGHTRRVCPTQALALTSLAGKSLGEAENQGKLVKLVRSSWLSQPWWPMAIMAYRPFRQETAINEASHPEVASRRTTRCDFGKMSWPWWKKHHLGIETGTVVSKLVIEAAKTDLSSMPRWLACGWQTPYGTLNFYRHNVGEKITTSCSFDADKCPNPRTSEPSRSMQMFTFEPNLRQLCWRSWDCPSVLKHVFICCLQGISRQGR